MDNFQQVERPNLGYFLAWDGVLDSFCFLAKLHSPDQPNAIHLAWCPLVVGCGGTVLSRSTTAGPKSFTAPFDNTDDRNGAILPYIAVFSFQRVRTQSQLLGEVRSVFVDPLSRG
jgi:hypothetical protein